MMPYKKFLENISFMSMTFEQLKISYNTNYQKDIKIPPCFDDRVKEVHGKLLISCECVETPNERDLANFLTENFRTHFCYKTNVQIYN